MEDFIKGLPYESIGDLASTLGAILTVILVFYGRRILHKIDLMDIEQKSTDYALEKSMGNGWTKHKSEKKQELLRDAKYINKG